jgi:hypothetical protein
MLARIFLILLVFALQVAPTLTLCGVATSYFQLCTDSDEGSGRKRIQLLASQDVTNMIEWQHLVESCILFMARNGLQHSTLYFLRKAAAFSSCGAMTNLLHYAVVNPHNNFPYPPVHPIANWAMGIKIGMCVIEGLWICWAGT